jgi:hypothetical protein
MIKISVADLGLHRGATRDPMLADPMTPTLHRAREIAHSHDLGEAIYLACTQPVGNAVDEVQFVFAPRSARFERPKGIEVGLPAAMVKRCAGVAWHQPSLYPWRRTFSANPRSAVTMRKSYGGRPA